MISNMPNTITPSTPKSHTSKTPTSHVPSPITPLRHPKVLVATPKSRTPKNEVIYDKNSISRALIAATQDDPIDIDDLIADSREIVLKENMKCYVRPRDVDNKRLEEIKQKAANDKTIDLLSQLRQNSTQSFIIGCHPLEDSEN